jgi:hypothetical protein
MTVNMTKDALAQLSTEDLERMLAARKQESAATIGQPIVDRLESTCGFTKSATSDWVGATEYTKFTDDAGREWGVKITVTAKNNLARKSAR